MISVPDPLDALEAEMRRLCRETRAAYAAGDVAATGKLLGGLHRAQLISQKIPEAYCAY